MYRLPRSSCFQHILSCYFPLAFSVLVSVLVSVPISSSAEDNNILNVYSYRQAYLLQPLLAAFEDQTNIKTNVIYAKTGLISRIKTEGIVSPADVLIAPSYDVLHDAIKAGITTPMDKRFIPADTPSWLADTNGRQWLALSVRSRIIFASKDRVPAGTIDSYLDLASPKFKGKICMRSGLHPYNTTLFSEIYSKLGQEKTTTFLKKLKSNLARRPQGNDREQLRAVSSGICDFAIANSYYYFILKNGDSDQKSVASAVYPISPSLGPIETHVNISGIVLARHIKHKEQAEKFISFMVSDTAQRMYTEQNREWPVSSETTASIEPGFVYTKNTPPDWNAIIAAKKEVVRILNDINFNE